MKKIPSTRRNTRKATPAKRVAGERRRASASRASAGEARTLSAQLDLLSSVQAGLASQVDIQGIYEVVGEKIQKLFGANTVVLATFDLENDVMYRRYEFEAGERHRVDPHPIPGLWKAFIEGGEPVLVRSDNAGFVRSIDPEYRVPVGKLPKSGLSVPLKVRGEVRGVISLQDVEQENAFTESDMKLLVTLAGSMSLALENARLFGETRHLLKETDQRAAELAIINSIQHGLASRLDIRGIYELVGDKIREIFMAQAVLIASYEEDGTRIVGRYLVEKGQRFYPNADGSDITPFHRRFLEQGSTLFLSRNANAELEKLGAKTIPGTEPVRSAIFVPLTAGGHALGMLSLQNVDRDDAFSASDVHLLETIASSMGVALENARLFDEVQTSNRALSAALEQQTATTEVLRVLSGSQAGLKSLLEIIALNAAKVCGADDAHIYRVEGNVLKEWTHRGPIPGLEEGEWLPLNRGSIIGRAVLDQVPIHIRDAAQDLDEREYPISTVLQRRWGTHSNLAVPLLRDGKSIGGIAIRRLDVKPFSDEEIALLRTFADQAVIAIENTRLFEETTQLLRETEQRAAELSVINSVQQGLASKLDIQAIYELVGEQVRLIFDANTVVLATFDTVAGVMDRRYVFERGQRFFLEPTPIPQIWRAFINQGRTQLINSGFEAFLRAQDPEFQAPAGEIPKSTLTSPLRMQGQVRGAISLQNVEREDVFTESDQRLLETLANSMSVALENASLFDETQRLLKETEQRAAELAIINSVQHGLAANLDIQGIYDLVGEELRAIFKSEVVEIATYDRNTDLLTDRYCFDRGDRTLWPAPLPLFGFRKQVVRSRSSLVINRDMRAMAQEYGNVRMHGSSPKAAVFVPVLNNGEVHAILSLQDIDHEDAFSASDVRLL
ncbi:MAG TPA: GAF domain-containing protein, partial [Anaerolineales bacterium]|nr:GAF domain-containing protein [Anaerolineales bacterium]